MQSFLSGNCAKASPLEVYYIWICVFIDTRVDVWNLFALLFQGFGETDWVKQTFSVCVILNDIHDHV